MNDIFLFFHIFLFLLKSGLIYFKGNIFKWKKYISLEL